MLVLVALAIGCMISFDSLFIHIGGAIVITLIALLVPIHFIFRNRDRRK